jgi:hypothetical protein
VKNQQTQREQHTGAHEVRSVLVLSVIERPSHPLIAGGERFSRHVGLFASFDVEVTLADYSFGRYEL